jgi:deoxyribonuclease-4
LRDTSRQDERLIIGAHLSTAGGLHMALERARELRCLAVQLFTHNRAQWRIPRQTTEAVERFRRFDEQAGPFALAAHASYLINLASPDRNLRERSIRTMITEVRLCHALGIPLLVFHPGAHMGAGEVRGLRRVVQALDRIHRATVGLAAKGASLDALPKTVIETTAGQGTGLGWRFEQIAAILDGLADPDRARVCFDTAHAFAAGYDLRTPQSYEEVWAAFDRTIGLDKLAIFHVNDSRMPLGARVDRHAHIGRGEIGRRPFGWILTDPRFRALPKVLETPKEGGMDRKNLATLRRVARMMPWPEKG